MSGRRSMALMSTGALLAAVTSVGLFNSPAALATDGDAAAAGADAFTAKIDIGGARACTGTLLDNQWIITATSCFADDPAQYAAVKAGTPALESTATIARTDLTDTDAGQVRQITEIVPRADRDITLARLASPVYGVAHIHAAATAPVAGEGLHGAGYGRTATEWVPDRLHTADFTVGSVDTGTLAYDGTPVCKGDTGGPVFRTVDGRTELVAVTSQSWEGGCLGSDATRTGDVGSRVDDIRDWIAATTATTAGVWHMQMLATTTSGLYHGLRDTNGEWTSFGNVQGAAGSVQGLAYADDAAINGKNYVFALGGDGHVYESDRRTTGGWDAFHDITPALGAKTGMTRIAVTSTGPGLALLGIAGGRVYHAVQAPDETWSKWGDVTAEIGLPAGATEVATAQTSGGNTQIGVIIGGEAYHAIRLGGGTWSKWGRITSQAGAPASVGHIAFAGIGGDLQVVLSTPDGTVKHTIRDAAGHWTAFGDLTTPLGNRPYAALAATAVNGELQMLALTQDGEVEHLLRHADGTWDAVDRPSGFPGTAIGIAMTGSTK
jgi:hypothetical protein